MSKPRSRSLFSDSLPSLTFSINSPPFLCFNFASSLPLLNVYTFSYVYFHFFDIPSPFRCYCLLPFRFQLFLFFPDVSFFFLIKFWLACVCFGFCIIAWSNGWRIKKSALLISFAFSTCVKLNCWMRSLSLCLFLSSGCLLIRHIFHALSSFFRCIFNTFHITLRTKLFWMHELVCEFDSSVPSL